VPSADAWAALMKNLSIDALLSDPQACVVVFLPIAAEELCLDHIGAILHGRGDWIEQHHGTNFGGGRDGERRNQKSPD